MRHLSPEFQKSIQGWLESQGYPLEMQVAQACAKVGFSVEQSTYYKDPESGEPRETDVEASEAGSSIAGELYAEFKIVIECKSSVKHPWLVFSRDRNDPYLDHILDSKRFSSNIPWIVLREAFRASEEFNVAVDPPSRVGYGVTETFTSGKDEAFAACMSVAKCAAGRLAEVSSRDQMGFWTAMIVMPVVVVNSPLVECWVDTGTGVQLAEVDSTVVLWRRPIANVHHTLIRLVSANAIDKFLADSITAARMLLHDQRTLQLMLDHIRRVSA